MIIENYPLKRDFKRDYFYNGVIFDTCVLLVFFLDKYIKLHPDKKHILKGIVTEKQAECLNTLMINLRFSKIIITPHIFAEFLNRLRSDFKECYKDIKKECFGDLEKCGEIIIEKDNMIKHNHFIEFGNDISLVLATEEHIKSFKHSCILSFDGRFIEKFFRDTKNEILAFNLNTLQYLL